METRSQRRKCLSRDEVNPNLALLSLPAPCNPAKEIQPRRINRSTSQKIPCSNDYEENTLLKCSDLQFEELERKVGLFLKFGAYANPNLSRNLVLLAQHCILFSRLLESNEDALIGKWKILSRVIRQIICFARAPRSGPYPPSTAIIAVLEVFIKEFKERPNTQHYLVSGNDGTGCGKNLIDASPEDPSFIQELINVQKQMFGTFAEAVSGNASTGCNDKQILELGLGFGLDSTSALLGTSLSSSSPMHHFIQAHLSMLSTRYIDTLNLVQDSDSGTPDCAVSPFELSKRKELPVTPTTTKQPRNVNIGSSSKRKSSEKIAKAFLKVKRLCDDEKREMKTCNGRAFLEDPQDWEDLEDFIECEEGKNYSAWFEWRYTLRERYYAEREKKRNEQIARTKKDLRAFGSIERKSNKGTRSRARIL